ncbi:unnamed protein product, partial [Brassica rapa subsp. narinosa]
GRTRACQSCFACPSFDVAFGIVCGPLDCFRLRFSIDPSNLDAGADFKIFSLSFYFFFVAYYGSTALSCRLSDLDSIGLDQSKSIVSLCLIIKLMKFT